jgi:RNase P subunit RPR2
MKFDRKFRTGVVWRQTIKEKMINTVFLTKTVDVKFCKCCQTFLPKTDFYFESKSNSKYPEQLRNICINCYDIAKGRYLNEEPTRSRYKPEDPAITLDSFF